ncbi:predicted protein [Naegleria gruberi]|uniref:Predicted protein n=1 Tax=Naegleria gruberi TaxID=5762 RepID=D2VF49_NAEGR|nr:uncharacterized protein NAEGRDRAFT_67500 [Naegleria gruberi]EFC44713.1 predicted protein [Naegleria gruberi]|eukprot:XP_002677457.1 predicted protein [Naegleria gruberi strain NEG-M]
MSSHSYQFSATLMDEIWQADENRLTPVKIKPQGPIGGEYICVVCGMDRKRSNPNFTLFKLYQYDATKHVYVQVKNSEFLQSNSKQAKNYKLISRLFDNYSLDQHSREVNTEEERKEVEQFLESIVQTKCMRILGQKYMKLSTPTELKVKLREIWFKQYNLHNYKDLSGFEHLVVGEKNGDKVSGYHYWFKYLLDDSTDNHTGQDVISFAGRLDNESTPDYVCVRFKQDEDVDGDGQSDNQLFKSCGSFFVGISPECLLALSTLAYLESLQPSGKKNLSDVKINGNRYVINVFNEGGYPRSIYPSLIGQ